MKHFIACNIKARFVSDSRKARITFWEKHLSRTSSYNYLSDFKRLWKKLYKK